MWIDIFILILIGTTAGFMVSAGVVAFITSIGVITRLIGKTRTAKHILWYEMTIFLGVMTGNFIYFFDDLIMLSAEAPWNYIIEVLFGGFAGIFVGCLATSLAESVKATAIFSRRIIIHKGMGIIILSVALGKLVGALMFFYNGWYK